MQRTDFTSLCFYTAYFTSSIQDTTQKKQVQSLSYRKKRKKEALEDEGLDLIKNQQQDQVHKYLVSSAVVLHKPDLI